MRRTLSLLAALAAGLAGCGGDDGGSGPATTVPAGQPLSVVAKEYSFDPDSIVVTGASTLEIELKNEGAQAHDLRVRRGEEDLGGTPVFGPGQQKSGQVQLEPGEYEIFCSVGNHEQLGMKGTLTVE